MRFDASRPALEFASPEEAERFHQELTGLLREVMVSASAHEESPEAGKARSREVFREFASVVRALNALRQSLPRRAPGE